MENKSKQKRESLRVFTGGESNDSIILRMLTQAEEMDKAGEINWISHEDMMAAVEADFAQLWKEESGAQARAV